MAASKNSVPRDKGRGSWVKRGPSSRRMTHVVEGAAPFDAPLAVRLVGKRGLVQLDSVASTFGMSKGQLAETIGLSRDALYKRARLEGPKAQSRLKEMLEIVSRISDWAGGKEQAMAWYRAQPIAAFGGRTAESLVKDGQAGALRDYLDHIALGGFA